MKLVNIERLLPADLPPGEKVLWHGRPDWLSLMRHAFRGDLVAAYFGAMALWSAIAADSGEAAALAAGRTLGAGTATVALLGFLAWLAARTTLYVVTSKRVVMRVGVALPVFFNLPFAQIESAAVHLYTNGAGDIPLVLKDEQRVAYLQLWPHARPWNYAHPQPMLRDILEAQKVADILSRAMIAACAPGQGALAITTHPALPAAPESVRGVPAVA